MQQPADGLTEAVTHLRDNAGLSFEATRVILAPYDIADIYTPPPIAVWSDVEPGAGRQPMVTISDAAYPDEAGVQFLVNGEVDDRNKRAREDGRDETGPRDDSEFHIYPDLILVEGDVLEARFTSIDGTEHSVTYTVLPLGEPVDPPVPPVIVTPPVVVNPPDEPTTGPPSVLTLPDRAVVDASWDAMIADASDADWADLIAQGEAGDWGPWDDVMQDKFQLIRGWYLANTGLNALGLTRADLTKVRVGDILDDDVVVEGAWIQGSVNCVGKRPTIRASFLDISGERSFGLQAKNGGDGWLAEYNDFGNTAFERTGHYDQRAHRPWFVSRSGTGRFNQNLNGFNSGWRSVTGRHQTLEYNFTDHIVRSPKSHNSGMTIRSETGHGAFHNMAVRRNLLLDGTSTGLTCYPRSNELHHDNLFEENIVGLPYTPYTNYAIHRGQAHGDSTYRHSNVQWIGNIVLRFLLDGAPKPGGKSGPWRGDPGDVSSGNRYLEGMPL